MRHIGGYTTARAEDSANLARETFDKILAGINLKDRKKPVTLEDITLQNAN